MLLLVCAAAAPAACAMVVLRLLWHSRSMLDRLAGPLSLTATGLLIALSLSHLLPEALEEASDPHLAGYCALGTVMLLIFIEMFFNAGHAHHHGPERPLPQAMAAGGFGILAGTALHTFVDGVMIAAAFAVDRGLGLAAAAAILAHELPQELGDYTLLLQCGLNRTQAFVVNITSMICCTAGALSSSLIIDQIEGLLPYVLSVSAASFIYVALSDLLPRLRHSDSRRLMVRRYALLCLGVVLALLISRH